MRYYVTGIGSAAPHIWGLTRPAGDPPPAYALSFATCLADGTLRDLVVSPGGQTVLALTNARPSSTDEISVVRIGP